MAKLSKKAKILLYSGNICNLGEGMLGPLFAVYAEKIGGNVLDISWAWAAYLMVSGLLVMAVGKISDKKARKKKLLFAGTLINTLFTLGYLFVRTPMDLVLVSAGLGLGNALTAPTWTALFSKYENQESRGESWGTAIGQAELISGVAVVMGGIIVGKFSFETLFIIMATLQLAGAAILLKLFERKPLKAVVLRIDHRA